MIFLSSGVARQHRKAHGDNISLLLYGISNIRYYKHNTSVVSFLTIISNCRHHFFLLSPQKNEIFDKFRGHV